MNASAFFVQCDSKMYKPDNFDFGAQELVLHCLWAVTIAAFRRSFVSHTAYRNVKVSMLTTLLGGEILKIWVWLVLAYANRLFRSNVSNESATTRFIRFASRDDGRSQSSSSHAVLLHVAKGTIRPTLRRIAQLFIAGSLQQTYGLSAQRLTLKHLLQSIGFKKRSGQSRD